MLNWPARKSKPAAGSISSVQMSVPSRRTRATRSMIGSIGSAIGPAGTAGPPRVAAGTSARCAVDIEHLEPGRLQSFDQDWHEPHHHGVAKIVIAVALLTQTFGVDPDRANEIEGAGVVGPAIRRDEPGESDHVTLRDGLERDRCATWCGHLKSDSTVADEEELVRRIVLAEEILAGVEADVARAARDELDDVFAQAREEAMLADDLVHAIDHIVASLAVGCSRMSRTSSVMSMPTGHQVMHRPQPTQPEEPNWSIQVASLWVIHWR